MSLSWIPTHFPACGKFQVWSKSHFLCMAFLSFPPRNELFVFCAEAVHPVGLAHVLWNHAHESLCYPSLAVWYWSNYKTFLSLCFLICDMEILILYLMFYRVVVRLNWDNVCRLLVPALDTVDIFGVCWLSLLWWRWNVVSDAFLRYPPQIMNSLGRGPFLFHWP